MRDMARFPLMRSLSDATTRTIAKLYARRGANIRADVVRVVLHIIVIFASVLLLFAAFFGFRVTDVLPVRNFPIDSGGGIRTNNLRLSATERLFRERLTPTNQTSRARLMTETHDKFNAPFRFLQPLSAADLDQLLALLHTPSAAVIPLPTSRILFAKVVGADLAERTRALASILALTKNTDRVGVVYWNLHLDFDHTFESLFHLHCHTNWPRVLVVNVLDRDVVMREKNRLQIPHGKQQLDEIFGSSVDPGITDWAEFSVHQVTEEPLNPETTDAPLPSNRSREAAVKVNHDKVVAGIHEAAPRDVHIAFTLAGALRSRYSSLVDSEDLSQRYLVAKTKLAKSVMASMHLSVKQLAAFDHDKILRALHDEFQIPSVLLDGLRPTMARLLLDKLVLKKQHGTFAPRTVWVQPQYGLGNRLRTLGSVMAFAKVTNRVLVVIWTPDVHLEIKFQDLFLGQDNIIVSDAFQPLENWPYLRLRTRDTAMHAVDWFNYMSGAGVDVSRPTDPIADHPTKHVFVSSAYVVRSNVIPDITKVRNKHWQVLRDLTPSISVGRLVERTAHRFELGDVIGVHVRGRLIKKDIAGVSKEAYGNDSAKRTDFWRSLTNVDAFVAEMHRHKKSQQFYVATDDRAVLQLFDREFPGRVTYTNRKCDSRKKECIPYALTYILLLAKFS